MRLGLWSRSMEFRGDGSLDLCSTLEDEKVREQVLCGNSGTGRSASSSELTSVRLLEAKLNQPLAGQTETCET